MVLGEVLDAAKEPAGERGTLSEMSTNCILIPAGRGARQAMQTRFAKAAQREQKPETLMAETEFYSRYTRTV